MVEPPGPHLPEGRYFNYFRLTHSREEFLLALGQLLPGDSEPVYQVRIVTTATWAQVLWRILGESLTNYRDVYGTIPNAEDNGPEK